MNEGILNLVGIGPGDDLHITPAVLNAIRESEYVIGYSTYIGLVRHLLTGKQVTRTGMTEEIGRAQAAVEAAASGKKVTLISSGDVGVYGMAGLVFEVLRKIGWKRGDSPEIRILPGISADNSCASLVGAPLVHDSCRISLSDLLTPWPVIAKRIEAATSGDFVISLYNPASGRRQRQILEAAEIIGRYRPAETPVALVKSAYRRRQSVVLSDLEHFLEFEIGMNTTVIVGSTNSFVYEGYFVTPRGYTNKYSLENGEIHTGQRKGFSLRTEGSLHSQPERSEERTLNITKITGAFVRTATSVFDGEEEREQEPEELPQDKSVQTALKAIQLLQGTVKSVEKPKELGIETKSTGRLGRLGGAVLYETDGEYYLIGNLKQPCNFEDFGFFTPEETIGRCVKLRIGNRELAESFVFPYLIQGGTSPEDIYEKFSVYRNSSISERLFTLVRDNSDKVIWKGTEYSDLRWIGSMPLPVWNIVRESILKCS